MKIESMSDEEIRKYYLWVAIAVTRAAEVSILRQVIKELNKNRAVIFITRSMFVQELQSALNELEGKTL